MSEGGDPPGIAAGERQTELLLAAPGTDAIQQVDAVDAEIIGGFQGEDELLALGQVGVVTRHGDRYSRG